MRRSILILTFGALILFSGCLEMPGAFSAIPPGPWRATLQLAGTGTDAEAFDERTEGALPFNFEVIYDRPDSFHIELINGKERIVLDEISFGRDRRLGKDTIRIEFPAFGSYISAKYEEDAIEGFWHAPNRGADYKVAFRAIHGNDARFTQIDKPDTDVSGEWACQFEIELDNPYPAIGAFEQEESGKVTGTFLTETGDYRYLEGKMAADRLYLSVFDGAHAFLFEAKYMPDGTLNGIFRSGSHYKTYWTARQDTTIVLKDPYSLTFTQEGNEFLDFSFPNAQGEMVSLDDPRYVGKPKLVQIMGTWCPNCHDETRFLVEYLETHPNRDFEVIALAFELNTSKEKAMQAIRTYKKVMNIDYEMLYAGTDSKSEASAKLPILSSVVSYPTLLFVDRDNRVVKVHTGFSGPATELYEEFTTQFEKDLTLITY